MSELEGFLVTLQEASPIQTEYEKRLAGAIGKIRQIKSEQQRIADEANEQILQLQGSIRQELAKINEEAEPIRQQLKPLEDKTRLAIASMLEHLPTNDSEITEDSTEEKAIRITPEALISIGNQLPTEEATSKFTLELLSLVCIKDGEIGGINLSIYRSPDTHEGIFTVEGNYGAVDIHFNLDIETEKDNDMVEIILLDEDEEEYEEEDLEETEENEYEENQDEDDIETNEVNEEDLKERFQHWANHLPTLDKLVVLGFFTYLANQNQ